MKNDISKPSILDLKLLYQFCSQFQKERKVTDSSFIADVERYYATRHVPDEDFSMYGVSTHGRHRKTPPKRLKDNRYYHAIKAYLVSEGYMHTDNSITEFVEGISDFYNIKSKSKSSGTINEFIGSYLYFQRSSWYENKVQVSHFNITKGIGTSSIVTLEEIQLTGKRLAKSEGRPETSERFNGIGFKHSGGLYFMMREAISKRPKNCIIHDSFGDIDGNPACTLHGITLKGTKKSHMHVSNIVLLRREIGDETESEAISTDECRKRYYDVWKNIVENNIGGI